MRRVENFTPVFPFRVGDLTPYGDVVRSVEKCKFASTCGDDYYKKICGKCQISISSIGGDLVCGFYMIKNYQRRNN